MQASGSDELRQQARTAGRVLGLAAILLMPAWSGFDWLLEPERALSFSVVRAVGEVPMAALLWVLWVRPFGRRHAEALTVAILAVPQLEIAWMVPRAVHGRTFYLLGFTLVIYGSGCLLAGRPRWTAALVGVTWLALGGSVLTGQGMMSSRDVLASSFYIATASLIGLLAHLLRHRLAERERRARADLEREQARTQRLLEQLERLSHEDPLTGLANRRRWDIELAAACVSVRAGGGRLAVVLADIDRFKQINDGHGHEVGDDALRAVAALLVEEAPDGGLVARLGGDELAVLLPGWDGGSAVTYAERIRRGARALHPSGRTASPVTLSLGVAEATGADASPRALLRDADANLYRAKETRDAVCAAPAARVPQQPGAHHEQPAV